MMKIVVCMAVICLTVITQAGVTTHLKLDCRTGIREPAVEGEELRFDASWCEGGDEVRIKENGTEIATGTAGVYIWRVGQHDSCRTLALEILSNGEVVGTETVQFGFGYISNMKARQLWPHNKVAIEFTVADDIGEVKSVNENLSVWCARGVWTNAASHVAGDRSAKPGAHRIIWDMEADGCIFASKDTTFGISVDEVSTSGVQLWENGPYWAECNVGAMKPEEYGYYFWWGDTVGYKRNASNNGWVSVKNGSAFSFSGGNCPTCDKKDTQLQSAGYIDATGNLVAAHDAATAHLGAPWRMPTDAEFSALINNCDTTWTTRNGVYGRLVTGRGAYSSKSIFLPAAGDGSDSYLRSAGSSGYYWSSTPDSGYSGIAWDLYLYSSNFNRSYSNRCRGQSVRPLRGFAK